MSELNKVLHAAIRLKLATIVVASRTRPAWYEAWAELVPESTNEERLAVYQAVRDSGCLPVEAGFYLVSWQIETMATEVTNVTLDDLDDQLAAIEEAHGLELGTPWPTSKAPKEWQEINHAWEAAWDDAFVGKLEEFGEHDMACQFRADPVGFENRRSRGREFFHGR